MFDVGPGIQAKMDELGDIPTKNSIFYHSIDGKSVSEWGFGLFNDYRAVQSEPGTQWIVYAYGLNYLGNPEPPSQQIVSVIDVSSHQSTDLTSYINQFNPDHIIIKFYQDIEFAGSQDVTRQQVASAQAHNVSVGGYGWLYRSQGHNINSCLDLAAELNIRLPILWIDVEPYNGVYPKLQDIEDAVEVCVNRSQPCGIYTGKWVWDALGNPYYWSYLPLWHSHYGIEPSLTLSNPYGGWTTCVGHQYTSTPIDQNIFDVQYTKV